MNPEDTQTPETIETPETPEVVEAPIEEPVLDAQTPAEEVPVIEAELAIDEGEDRSVYNCPDCSGLGLKDEYHVCLKCNGTGKIA